MHDEERVRVYLPATLATLAEAFVAGHFPAGYAAHAVTGAIREWYTDDDTEQLEYAAQREAADASLDLLGAEFPAEARYENRRVVVAADVERFCVESPGAAAVEGGEPTRSAVRLRCQVPMSAVVSVHVDEDDPAVRSAVATAVRALPLARRGDDDASFAVDEARSHELLWYDVTEIVDLI